MYPMFFHHLKNEIQKENDFRSLFTFKNKIEAIAEFSPQSMKFKVTGVYKNANIYR